jgi:competence protein ComEC
MPHLLYLALAFAFGLLAIETSALLPSWSTLTFVTCLGAFGFLIAWRFWPTQQVLAKLFIIWLFFAAGLLWGKFQGEASLEYAFQSQWLKQDILLEGHIVSAINKDNKGLSFRAAIHRSQWQNQDIPLRGQMQLRFYDSKYQKSPDLAVGQHFQAIARLKPPNSTLNPGGMDWEAYAWREGIVASGYIRDWRQLGTVTPSWLTLRHRLAAAMRDKIGESEGSAVVQAVSVGLRNDFEQEQWQTFAATGTSHLLAISGLHISLVAGLVFALFLGLGRLWPSLGLWLPISLLALLPALLAATFYSALAGFALPTQRALLILLAIFLLRLWRRPLQPWRGLGLALLIMLFLQPKSVLSPSLWLSFAAVAAIVYFFMGRRGQLPWWQQLLLLQLWLSVFMIPWTMLFFNQASLISPLANLIAIPYVSFSIVPLALLGVALWPFSETVAGWLWQLSAYLSDFLLLFLNFLGNLPGAALRLGARPWPLLWLGVFLTLWLFAPRAWPGKIPALLGLLLIVSWPTPRPASGEVWLTVVDVGQGLSVLIQTKHENLLFDTGKSGQGKQSIIPTLRTFGIQKLSLLMISHDDSDHSGSAVEVLQAIATEKILAGQPQPLAATLAAAKLTTPAPAPCFAGQSWQWDDVHFEVLHPNAQKRYGNDNAYSCVLLISNEKGEKILLTGDIGHHEEFALLRYARAANISLKSSIVIAGHHGSKHSSSQAFIEAVQAEAVIFTAGFANSYGHPDGKVVANFHAAGATPYFSAEHGAIQFQLTGKETKKPKTWRQTQKRYWRFAANAP